MAVYSIKDLEKLTGIKAHTIRIWEQRYGLIEPPRTPTNIRFYNDEHLRLIFNISVLLKQGYKISKLAKLGYEDIASKVTDLTRDKTNQNAQIDALILAMLGLDEAEFDAIFAKYALEHGGFEPTMMHLICPFLNRLNVLWLAKNISQAHEKFVNNLIRRKLMTAIEHEGKEVRAGAESFILYTPEGESQEFSLLYLQYLLRKRKMKVVYLGVNTPVSDLKDVCELIKPDYIFTIIDDPLPRQSLQSYIDYTASFINGSTMLFNGRQFFINQVNLPSNTLVFRNFSEIVGFIDTLLLRAS